LLSYAACSPPRTRTEDQRIHVSSDENEKKREQQISFMPAGRYRYVRRVQLYMDIARA
jgi:hypothetical protein